MKSFYVGTQLFLHIPMPTNMHFVVLRITLEASGLFSIL